MSVEIRKDKMCVECGTVLVPVFEILRVGPRPEAPTGIVEQFAGYWCDTCQIGGIGNPR